jgi:hypothetical protein
MEKPLLSPIIANETEAAITNEPFDDSARHNVLPLFYNNAKFSDFEGRFLRALTVYNAAVFSVIVGRIQEETCVQLV